MKCQGQLNSPKIPYLTFQALDRRDVSCGKSVGGTIIFVYQKICEGGGRVYCTESLQVVEKRSGPDLFLELFLLIDLH